MKTILRIILILLVTAIVAGGFYLILNNGTTTSSPSTTNTNGQSFQPMEWPGGDREGGSIVGAIGGVFGTIMKLGSIIFLVVLLEKGFNQLRNRKLVSIRQ